MIKYYKAFTTDASLGNPAAIVDLAVTSTDFEKFVKEAKHDVSVVLDSREESPYMIRFFYNYGDIETYACGHATVAAAKYLHDLIGISSFTFVNRLGNEFKITIDKNGLISQQQAVPTISANVYEPSEIAEALTINSDRIIGKAFCAGINVRRKVLVPIDLETLIGLDVDYSKVIKYCDKYEEVTGIIPYSTNINGYDAHARHFPDRLFEDSICGLGTIALSGLLNKQNGKTNFKVRFGPGSEGQGELYVETGEDYYVLKGNCCEYTP